MLKRRARRGFRKGRRGKILCVPLRNPLHPLRFIIILTILNLALITSSFSQVVTQTIQLLESGRAKNVPEAPKALARIKIVSYNIRWRTGTQLAEIARWLKGKDEAMPLIIGLQEVDRAKKRTGNANNARKLADDLGLYYAWAAPPTPKSDKSGGRGNGR